MNVVSYRLFANSNLKLISRAAFRPFHVTLAANVKTMSVFEKSPYREMFSDELRLLQSIFIKHGHELRIAGGAVRDLLMGKVPKDIDLATTATPDQMKLFFTEEGIRMLNMRGESHGTITTRINDKENFEVTTLRIDTATDGRHAKVQFTTDWQLDAGRRDLTINSMFLGFDGTVYDYFGGVKDVVDRKVRFVGDPNQRIREDYLRILRYFRFYGRIAKNPDDHDQATLTAIRENISGLAGISGERIWLELKQILMGNYVAHLIPLMLDTCISSHIGLPNDPPIDVFITIYERMKHLEPQPLTILATLLKNEEEMLRLHFRLKLSADERDLGLFVVTHRADKPSVDPQSHHPMRPYQLLVLRGIRSGVQRKKQLQRMCELFKYRGETERMNEFLTWDPGRFPIDGHVLRERGIRNSKQFSMILDTLLVHWVDSDYKLDRDQLLERLDPILEKLGKNGNETVHNKGT